MKLTVTTTTTITITTQITSVRAVHKHHFCFDHGRREESGLTFPKWLGRELASYIKLSKKSKSV